MDKISMNFLREIPIFQIMPEIIFYKFINKLKIKILKLGETLFQQEDQSDGIYIVTTGRLYYEKSISEYGNIRKVRGEFTRGSIVGDIALLTGGNRSASVVAYRDSELLFLSLSSWNLLFLEFPECFIKISQLIFSNYFNSTSKEFSIPQRMISVMPLSNTISENFFSESLKKSLEKHGKVNILRRSQYKQLSKAELKELFYQVEKDSTFTIFETCFDTEWTNFCFHHSDRIFILDEVSGKGGLRREEVNSSLGNQLPNDLVLLTNESLSYIDTSRWINDRNIQSKFFVNMNNPKDFDRLARHIAGKSVGIALGGGGARGFAHIGVMEGFRDLGIEVDMISGTSIGSIIGSLYALKYDSKTIFDLTKKYFVDRNPTGDFYLSPVSLTKGEVFTNSLKEAFHNKLIEYLDIPFYAIACNLTKGKLHIFDTGEIWKALRASSSIPGLSPPLLIENELFIDGGILNNLPCDILKDRGAHFVVGIDVTGQDRNQYIRIKDYLANDAIGISPSFFDGWKHTAEDFLNGIQTPIIMEILVSSGMVGSKVHKESIKDSIDLLIQPNTDGYGLLDWKRMEELISKGRESIMSNEKEIMERINQ